MVKLRQAIVVEGRYDKNTLRQIVDAPIFLLNGFGIMHNRQQLALLRQTAKTRGLIILTDSDGAGFVLRNYLKGALPKEGVLHAYIPDVAGKERRKRKPGKEGKLGVEGMSPETLLQALKNAGASFEEGPEAERRPSAPITKADLAELGLSGGAGSQQARQALMKALDLPEHMSANALLEALNVLFEREEFLSRYEEIKERL